MKSKYIVLEQDSLELPFIFSELSTHADVARALRGKVLGAGFCVIQNDRYVCYGESISLEIESRGEVDSKILNSTLIY